VDLLALVVGNQRGDRPIVLDAPYCACAPPGHHQPPLPIERHAVGVAGRFDHDLAPHARLPLPNPAADDIDPEQLPFAAVPDRPLAKAESRGYAIERWSRIDQPE